MKVFTAIVAVAVVLVISVSIWFNNRTFAEIDQLHAAHAACVHQESR